MQSGSVDSRGVQRAVRHARDHASHPVYVPELRQLLTAQTLAVATSSSAPRSARANWPTLTTQAIESVLGPLSTTLDGCVKFFKAVLAGEPWRSDPTTVFMPFRKDELDLKHLPGKLCFGVLRRDLVFTPVPPINRALDMAIAAVRIAGHEVIEWTPESHPAINELAGKIFGSDGGQDYDEITKSTGEPRFGGAMVGTAKDALSAWQARLARQPLLTLQLWQECRRRDHFRLEYLRDWEATISRTSTGRPMDGLIAPAGPSPAFEHDNFVRAHWFAKLTVQIAPTYTMAFNVLDLPACVFPVTTVDASLDAVVPADTLSDEDAAQYARCASVVDRDRWLTRQTRHRRSPTRLCRCRSSRRTSATSKLWVWHASSPRL